VFESTALPLWQKTLTILLFLKWIIGNQSGLSLLSKGLRCCLKVYGILVLKDLIILFFDAIILKCPAWYHRYIFCSMTENDPLIIV
jgi:hypothetical protein